MNRAPWLGMLLVALFVLEGRCLGQEDPGRIFKEKPDDGRLQKAVTLDGYHPWDPERFTTSWKSRREYVRRQILVAAGLWPLPPRTPLEPVIHGKIERDDYSIEKVFFQSHPGLYVTGNLYRPRGVEGRRAGVLCPHGHWSRGRFYERPEAEARKQIEAGGESGMAGARYHLQARCVQLARMGCVVFHYDMVGNADSKQLPHGAGFGDLEAELRLESAFGVQTWNSIRALDFLSSLPDVDPERIGVTGASGGGTQTFILCAIDDRPAVAFPAVMISTAMQGGCVCENASHLRVGTSNVEFAALSAPLPYGMTGADDWTVEILTKGLPELKRVWGWYGAEGLVEAWCHPEFDHNYNQVSREHMYGWFNRHLKLGHAEPVRESSFEPVPPAELSVFDEAHSLPEDAVDLKGLREYLAKVSDEQMAALEPRDPESLREFRRVVGGALEVMLHTGFPEPSEVEARDMGTVEAFGRSVKKLALRRKGTTEAVPAILVKPSPWNGTVVVVVYDLGKSAACFRQTFPSHTGFKAEVEQLLSSGAAVLSSDLFLTGEFLDDTLAARRKGADLEAFPKDTERHERFVGYTYGYNRTLLAQRVHDLLTTLGYAHCLPGTLRVNLIGVKQAAHWALLARALAGDAVFRCAVSPRGSLDLGEMDSVDSPNFLPGARKYGGLPAFTALHAPAELWWVTSKAPRGIVRSAYAACGKPGNLRVIPQLGREEQEEILLWMAAPEE